MIHFPFGLLGGFARMAVPISGVGFGGRREGALLATAVRRPGMEP
jgi:hypothetical protein